MNNEDTNPWAPEDEREHFPSVMEWWCAITFFRTIEDNKKWSFKGSFTEWFEKPEKGSILSTTLFDQDTGKYLVYGSRNGTDKLEAAKDRFYVKYDDSFMGGLYPNYEMYFNDKENKIKFNINYKAEALPHWIAQDVTGGWLPLGLGFYRYGFIPKCKVSGTMVMNDKTYHIEGKGYFEHVWGSIRYYNSLENLSELKKSLSIYSKLIGWWIHNHKIRIPKSIKFSTENNPLGYDWAWALLDNGWMIFYGNILFWISEGPIAGALILSKDGKTYTEFCNVHFKYNKTQYSKKYDFYYPTELEATATKGKEKLHLKFKMTSESREYLSRFSSGKYWLGFVICEEPGIVDGYYFDGEKEIKLSGICKIEPQRQASIIGHNSLKIDFVKPPEGVGISFDLDSHYFRKKIFTQIQLVPRPKIKIKFKRIDDSQINKKTN
jgi:hypothetical protein